MALSLVTDPSDVPVTIVEEEPITLVEAKKQCRREDFDTDDELFVNQIIPAARERAEQATQRQLITATWDLKLDGGFPCGAIVLPKPPLQSVLFVRYVDGNGVTQTLTANVDYVVDAPQGPRAARGRIEPAYGLSWPTARCQMNAVTIRFVAGYGDDGSFVPPRLKQAMLWDIGMMYENREDMIVGQGYVISEFPLGAAAVYRSFKSWA